MNKRTIITALITIVSLVGQAQEIGIAKTTAEDYIELLNHQGYHVFALDLSNLEKDNYLLHPVIQIYHQGKLEQDLLEDLGIGYTNSSPKITIGLIPSKVDSLLTFKFQFDDVCSLAMTLPLFPVKNEAEGTEEISYKVLPFAIQPTWKENEFIPIAAYSSFWYDPDEKICRNCDALQFDKDFLNSNTFKCSPHIYVLGITINKR